MGKTNTNGEEPTPEKIFETFFAFASTRVFVTGIDLEIFTHIANGCHTSAEIAEVASASPRGMEILLNSLTGLNYITKSNGTYHLTPLAEKFLVKGRPAYFGDFVQHADLLWEPWSNLSEVVRTGKPFKRLEKEHGPEFFQEMVSRLFPMSYPGAKAAAEALGVGVAWKNLNVLDIGGRLRGLGHRICRKRPRNKSDFSRLAKYTGGNEKIRGKVQPWPEVQLS